MRVILVLLLLFLTSCQEPSPTPIPIPNEPATDWDTQWSIRYKDKTYVHKMKVEDGKIKTYISEKVVE